MIERMVEMYISEYCEVDYEEKYNVVLVKWKKFCCNQDYRKTLEYALDIIREYFQTRFLYPLHNHSFHVP